MKDSNRKWYELKFCEKLDFYNIRDNAKCNTNILAEQKNQRRHFKICIMCYRYEYFKCDLNMCCFYDKPQRIKYC